MLIFTLHSQGGQESAYALNMLLVTLTCGAHYGIENDFTPIPTKSLRIEPNQVGHLPVIVIPPVGPISQAI